MKRMSHLFSSDHRKPATSAISSSGGRPRSQQSQNLASPPHTPGTSFDTTFTAPGFPRSQSALDLHTPNSSAQNQNEQQWTLSNLRPPQEVPQRPSAAQRSFTGDSRSTTSDYPQLPGHLALPTLANLAALNSSRTSMAGTPTSARGSDAVWTQRTASTELRTVERSELHKLLKSIESLLINLDEYRALQTQLAKVEKRLGADCAELVKNKAVLRNPSNTLELAASSLTSQHEVGSRYAKLVQKEYDALNEACAKYFKTIAKEEKILDDFAAVTEDKIKKAQFAYEKSTRKGNANARTIADNHEKYISIISGLANETNNARSLHATAMANKSNAITLRVASTLGGIAESSFRAHCDAVRSCGPTVGLLAAALNFCISEAMPLQQPVALTEDEVGPAGAISLLEKQAEGVENAKQDFEAAIPATEPPDQNEESTLQNIQQEAQETLSQATEVVASTTHSPRATLTDDTPAAESCSPANGEQQATPATSPEEAQVLTETTAEKPEARSESPQPIGARASSSSTTSAAQNLSTSGSEATTGASESSSVNGNPSDNSSLSSSLALKPYTPALEEEQEEKVNPVSSLSPSPRIETIQPTYLDPLKEVLVLPINTLPLKLERRTSTSLWERRREDEERREREAALERRAREAEERLRFLEKATTSRASVRMENRHVHSPSPPPLLMSDHEETEYFSRLPPEPTQAVEDWRERDEYGHSISRNLSTASERSFVARMKSRYQQEKQIERAVAMRERERERLAEGVGREYSRYSPKRNSANLREPYEMPNSSPRPRFSSTSSGLPSVRSSSGLATSQQEIRRNSYQGAPAMQGPRTSAPAPVPIPVPHSDICGCQQCSAKHYAAPLSSPRRGQGQGGSSPAATPQVPTLPSSTANNGNKYDSWRGRPEYDRRRSTPGSSSSTTAVVNAGSAACGGRPIGRGGAMDRNQYDSIAEETARPRGKESFGERGKVTFRNGSPSIAG